MKTKNFSIVASLSTAMLLVVGTAAHAQNLRFDFGNPPYGSDPVSGVIGSGSKMQSSSSVGFGDPAQGKVNAVGATLTAASISGSQSVGGNTVNVDPAAAQAALDVVNSPAGSDSPAVATFTAALGGGEAAQQLTKSMQGLRGGDGSINATALTNAVSSYNTYIKFLIDSSKATEKPASELDGYMQSLPPGQKAAQVILGKLTEAAR